MFDYFQVPLIAYSTGERGLISQLLSPKFGGVLVYGSIEGNLVPGLPTLASLKEAYGVENIDADTKVFGLISKPVSHSKGPILHNPTFRHVGYNGVYVPMFVDDLKQFFNVYESPDFAGYRCVYLYIFFTALVALQPFENLNLVHLFNAIFHDDYLQCWNPIQGSSNGIL